MNYSEPLINQVVVFFRSVGAGIILGIIYSVINIIRAVFGERKSVYVFFDLAFFIIASFISFFFMVLYNSGQVRFNLMLGEAAGALSFYYSLGIYIVRTAEKYTDAVKKSVTVIISPVSHSKFTSQPTDLPIQFFCIRRVFSGQSRRSTSDKSSSA